MRDSFTFCVTSCTPRFILLRSAPEFLRYSDENVPYMLRRCGWTRLLTPIGTCLGLGLSFSSTLGKCSELSLTFFAMLIYLCGTPLLKICL